MSPCGCRQRPTPARPDGRVDCLATKPWYWRHLAPVWDALPHLVRGNLATPDSRTGTVGSRPTLVASWTDAQHVAQAILMEHGAGQSYGGDPAAGCHPSYAGGGERDNVILSLVPGPHPAARERAAGRNVVMVGCPALDRWIGDPQRPAGPTHPTQNREQGGQPAGSPLVALAFHWPNRLCPEADWALPHYAPALADLPRQLDVAGHAHPRAARRLAPYYRRAGIPTINYDDVLSRAQVVVVDNSSIGFEAAAVGKAVVWLDAPWYRSHHGLRFFDACPERVGDPGDLPDAIEAALAGSWGRRTDVGAVYAYLDDRAAQRAADAIVAAVQQAAA
jgi:hypothetical protein